ncbi:MAG: hypothetical protein ABW022_03100 [Actinoplanes sp.]
MVEVEEQVAATNDHLAATRGDAKYRDRADHARRQAQQAREVASAIRQGDEPSDQETHRPGASPGPSRCDDQEAGVWPARLNHRKQLSDRHGIDIGDGERRHIDQ